MRFKTSDNIEYNLEFNRDSVRYGESIGLNISDFDTKVMTTTELLFLTGFHKNHPEVDKAESDRILYEELGGLRPEETSRLVSEFLETYSTLINTDGEKDDKGEVKNVRRATIL